MPNRWLIQGTLRAKSPMRIGDGATVQRSWLKNEEDKHVKIGGVERDSRGLPIITGSSLKGVLHSALRSFVNDPNQLAIMHELFGSPEDEANLGGKAEFLDAIVDDKSIGAVSPDFPAIESGRDVRANVAIDRKRRSAAAEKLFYREFVPAGTRFNVKIAARNIEPSEAAFLLASLKMFKSHNISIGGGASNGLGKLEWEQAKEHLVCVDEDNISDWLSSGCVSLEVFTAGESKKVKSAKETAQRIAIPGVPPTEINVAIQLDGPFLTRKLMPAPPKKSGLPTAVPIKDLAGNYYLPAASFRGVLRAQAEKILRTITADIGVCDPSSDFVCDPVKEEADLKKCCLICQTFGVSGARSKLEFSDLTVTSAREYSQELLAIDRFTGGGADQKKFSQKAIYRPLLQGKIRHRELKDWQLGLLSLVIQDLIDGDVVLGAGSGRGYGLCQDVSVTGAGASIIGDLNLRTALMKKLDLLRATVIKGE